MALDRFAREVDRIETLEPIYSPPSALLIQQAQFAVADAHRGDADPAVMLYGLRQSAQQNYALAVVSLGVLYVNGDDVPLDRAEAYRWFWLAASQSDEMMTALSAALTEAEWGQVLE